MISEPLDEYAGYCALCGAFSKFAHFGGSPRESYRCGGCSSSIRERGLAQAVVDLYGDGQYCAKELGASMAVASLAICEPGFNGTIRPYARNLPGYRFSQYCAEASPGALVNGVPNEDLQRLSYESKSFDLVLTADILEHVRRPFEAFSEIKRVLKIGGRHVFTVPLHYPMRERTEYRVDTSADVDVPLLPRVYHGDGRGGKSLVYTDFGRDMMGDLGRLDMPTVARFVDAANVFRRKALVFVSTRVA